jgi:capsular polysaccharide biosynthesis protein
LNDRESTAGRTTDLGVRDGELHRSDREEGSPDQPMPDGLQRGSGGKVEDSDREVDDLDAEWAAEPRPDGSIGLASVGFIRATLWRRARVWGVLTLVGLLAGTLYLAVRPPAHDATVTLMLAGPPTAIEGVTIADDEAYVQSVTVAGQALRRLKLNESPTTFLHHYSAAAVTNSVLQITARAATSAEAVSQANALAAAFLSFQANMLAGQDQVVNAAAEQQIAQAQQHVNVLTSQISKLSAMPATPARTAELKKLRNEQTQAANTFAALSTTLPTDAAASAAINDGVIAGSGGLSGAVPVPWSLPKYLALYAGGGLIAGLAVGMAIVIIGALVSDRLRRRDEIARVLGAPVRLSTGPIPPSGGQISLSRWGQALSRLGLPLSRWGQPFSRWQPRPLGLDLAGNADVQQVVGYLRRTVRPSSGLPAGLALVPVDDAEVPAVCLTSLALSCAQTGLRVVLVDLCPGTPAGRLLGVTEPGVRSVTAQGAELIVSIPPADDIRPAGPLTEAGDGLVQKPLRVACSAADVLLTLADLDPAIGGQYLSGWATSVVAVVTAGRSSAARISAVGEMIRQSGIDEVSAVLLGTDKYDESFGGAVQYAGAARG